MKRFVCLFIIVCMCVSLCACGGDPSSDTPPERIGYVIIPHSDGDEHADIYGWGASYSRIWVDTMDGRRVIGNDLIIVLE